MSLPKERLEIIKKELLKRKKELEELLQDLSEHAGEDPQGQDLGDQALSSSMEALRQSLQHSERQEYEMINNALAAIEEGSYGICIDCEELISERRLRYHPNAVRCIGCQEALEEGSR